MNRKVLVMCTGNSCRSIIGEALIDRYLDEVTAYSCGVKPKGEVNSNAKMVLYENGLWSDKYYSKHLNEIIDIDFDLVVTVCKDAKEKCPIFPKSTSIVNIGVDDPDGQTYQIFEDTYNDIKDRVIPQIDKILKGTKIMKKNVFKTNTGVQISFAGIAKKEQIFKMVENCSQGKCECMSDETKKKITNMEVEDVDGDIKLNLSGDIQKGDIETALAKSKILNL
ncbi:MAG: arsenate reductase ArsC [Sulfurovum sp.]|nr:arsenate reductase ArsC [Sulfurovaceae bacterium]